MEKNFSQINNFFKSLTDFRETTNIADFFFLPHVAHVNYLLAGETTKKHSRRTFEISLVLTGDLVYTVKDKNVPAQSGDVIIIPPDTKHYWRVLEKDSEIFSLQVNISKHGEGSRQDFILLNKSIDNHNYRIKGFSAFESIIKQAIDEIFDRKPACRNKVVYLIRIAFIELIRVLLPVYSQCELQSNFPPARGESKKDIVDIVDYYIQDNIDHPISLLEISNYVGLSIGHLNSLFKNETKTTINQAIINKRLALACRHLKQTDRQIKDIATILGYRDVDYFYFQFKKKYGMTPSQYRKEV
jgi:AraC-like DNA-binding protein